MCRAVALGAVLALGVSCGHQATCDMHAKAQLSVRLAKIAYDGGKFDTAKTNYMNAIEQCSENYDARMGLAHTSRVYGNQLFQEFDQLVLQGKLEPARKKFTEAKENHLLSEHYFKVAIEERPDDLDPRYGLGLLWYEQCTSPIAAPFSPNDSRNRQRVRDDAIREFSHVIARQPDSSQAHRYRGLAYLAADKVEEGARDLKRYHDSRQDLYNRIVGSWPGLTPEEKKRKDTALREVEKEISDVREVVVLEHTEMMNRALALQKKEKQTPEDSQEIGNLTRQQLILEGMIKDWALTRLGEVEQSVVKRCREYLETINRGKVDDVIAFLAPRKGDEARLQKAVTAKVENETRYRNVKFRTVVVSGELANVGFACRIESKQGPAVESEITLRWRLQGGQWLVSDHP